MKRNYSEERLNNLFNLLSDKNAMAVSRPLIVEKSKLLQEDNHIVDAMMYGFMAMKERRKKLKWYQKIWKWVINLINTYK